MVFRVRLELLVFRAISDLQVQVAYKDLMVPQEQVAYKDLMVPQEQVAFRVQPEQLV